MTSSQHTPDPRPVFEGHRLAVSYVEAMLAADENQAAAILATIDTGRLRHNFLIGLTVTAQHALRLSKREPDEVIHAYRQLLDHAEHHGQQGQDAGPSFGVFRLAATYMAATFNDDEHLTTDILSTLTDEQDLHSFFAGLVGIIEHTFTNRPECPPAAFVTAYRTVLDQAERKAS